MLLNDTSPVLWLRVLMGLFISLVYFIPSLFSSKNTDKMLPLEDLLSRGVGGPKTKRVCQQTGFTDYFVVYAHDRVGF